MLSGDGDDHNPLSAGEFWRYDPSNDLWTQLTSHPGDAIWAPGSFVIGCDAYFFLALTAVSGNTTHRSVTASSLRVLAHRVCTCFGGARSRPLARRSPMSRARPPRRRSAAPRRATPPPPPAPVSAPVDG